MEQPFKHETIEQDIIKLSQEVKERQEKGEVEHPEAAVREALRERISAGQQGSPAPQTQAQEPASSSFLPVYLQKESPEVRLKVEELVDLAFHQGLNKAFDEAGQYGPFVLDALHDTLTSRLYEELKNRGLL